MARTPEAKAREKANVANAIRNLAAERFTKCRTVTTNGKFFIEVWNEAIITGALIHLIITKLPAGWNFYMTADDDRPLIRIYREEE